MNDPESTAQCSQYPMLPEPGRLLFGGLGFFAGWTLGCHVVVLLDLEARALWFALLIAVPMGVIGAARATHLCRQLDPELARRAPAFSSMTNPVTKRLVVRSLATVIAAAISLYLFVSASTIWPLWTVLLVSSGYWYALSVKSGPACARPVFTGDSSTASRSIDRAFFVALIVVVLAAYFLTLKPDGDDAFYLNVPVAIATGQHGVMRHDTMFGNGEWPLLMPTYRAESLPALSGFLATVTGSPVSLIAHAVLPGLWCLIFSASLYVLGRLFFGGAWITFALFVVLYFLALDGSLQGYAAHGIVRFFHGKAPLILIVVPIIAVAAWRMAQKPTVILGGALVALQICAVGLTANGIYIAPLALGISALASILSVRPANAFQIVPALLCTAYPGLVAGALLATTTPFGVEEWNAPSISNDAWMLFPHSYTLAIAVGVIALGLGLSTRFAPLKGLPAYLLVLLVFVINPFLWPIYSDLVTGNLNYRLSWLAPLPYLAATVTTVAWTVAPNRGRIALVMAGLILLFAPASVLRPENGTLLNFSLVKKPPGVAATVRSVNALTPQGARVLASRDIAQWIPTEEGHRYPVAVREDYLDVFANRIDSGDIASRRRLLQWASGEDVITAPSELRDLLARYCVGTIVIESRRSAYRRLSDAIEEVGGARVASSASHAIFSVPLKNDKCIEATAPKD